LRRRRHEDRQKNLDIPDPRRGRGDHDLPLFLDAHGSIKTYNEITAFPIVWWPKAPQLSNYSEACPTRPSTSTFFNTVVVSAVITAVTLLTTIFAALPSHSAL
jgi:ABC-type glycerol-3-phosphate transport system permease component